MTKFETKLKELDRPLVLDGAMGALLQAKGLEIDEHLWASILNITAPEEVKSLHRAYAEAGAEIITTNTFRTNPAAVKQSGLNINVKDFVKNSVRLAKEVADEFNIFVAGSNSPAEDCYQKEVTLTEDEIISNHSEHIELLWESGVDFILNETQGHLFEIEFVSDFCNKNNIPFVTSLFFTPDLKLLSSEPLEEGIEAVLSRNPIAVSFNCILPKTFKKFFTDFNFNFDWGLYFNCGGDDYDTGKITSTISPDDYINEIKTLANEHTVFIGSCCGSTPEHTRAIRDFVESNSFVTKRN